MGNDGTLAEKGVVVDEEKELPKRIRQQYIEMIKGIKPLRGEENARLRKDVFPTNQSVLYLLRNVEALRGFNMVGEALEDLEKVPLMLRIGKEIGHRPDAISFSVDAKGHQVPERVLTDFFASRLGGFIKKNMGFRGEDVVYVTKKRDEGFFVLASLKKTTFVENLQNLELSPGLYIVEDNIPIALTGREGLDARWEIRHMPPFFDDLDCAKVGFGLNKRLNNIAQGGNWIDAKQTVEVVLRRGNPKLNSGEVEVLTNAYISRSQELALKVKQMTDRMQVAIAKRIFKPEDFKDSSSYEKNLEQCFSGAFLTVDITGVWDRLGVLQPVIIEAQTSASLPPFVVLPRGPYNGNAGIMFDESLFAKNYRGYDLTLKALGIKMNQLQGVLK